MIERLHPDAHQQEDRARQAKAFADAVEQRENGTLTVTLKGEAIEIKKDGKEWVVIANADRTFSMTDGPSHLDADGMLTHVLSA